MLRRQVLQAFSFASRCTDYSHEGFTIDYEAWSALQSRLLFNKWKIGYIKAFQHQVHAQQLLWEHNASNMCAVSLVQMRAHRSSNFKEDLPFPVYELALVDTFYFFEQFCS